MRELPEPDGENDRFFDPGTFVYTRESVLAIQKQAYEDGLRDAQAPLIMVLRAVQNYLPPDGTPIKDAMSEIIGAVDPWPFQKPVDCSDATANQVEAMYQAIQGSK